MRPFHRRRVYEGAGARGESLPLVRRTVGVRRRGAVGRGRCRGGRGGPTIALAGGSGLSRFQVVRGFARATGLPPHACLLQRRVHLARRLIAAGTPLAEVAARRDFADQSHLTRVFGRTIGLPPGACAAARRTGRAILQERSRHGGRAAG